jgi:hypothetical protein
MTTASDIFVLKKNIKFKTDPFEYPSASVIHKKNKKHNDSLSLSCVVFYHLTA